MAAPTLKHRYPVALVQLHWLPPDEGGRLSGPPPGPGYAATGYFSEDSLDDLISIVLRLDHSAVNEAGQSSNAALTMLHPENFPQIRHRFKPGAVMHITEGARCVADCRFISVSEEEDVDISEWLGR